MKSQLSRASFFGMSGAALSVLAVSGCSGESSNLPKSNRLNISTTDNSVIASDSMGIVLFSMTIANGRMHMKGQNAAFDVRISDLIAGSNLNLNDGYRLQIAADNRSAALFAGVKQINTASLESATKSLYISDLTRGIAEHISLTKAPSEFSGTRSTKSCLSAQLNYWAACACLTAASIGLGFSFGADFGAVIGCALWVASAGIDMNDQCGGW